MKFKRLIPALCMLLVSAVVLGTSTYAWFSMNTTVQATNMQVKAVAEDGLLINEVATAADAHWDNEGTANQTASTAVLLHPASTANGTTWYHAASKVSGDSASATSGAVSTNLKDGAYETLSGLVAITSMTTAATAGTNAARETMGKTATDTAGYYVHYTYYLKGASGTATTLGTTSGNQNVAINSVTATAATSASTALNPSLRVGIKLATAFYIYAPIGGFTDTYYVNASSTATQPIAGTTQTYTDLATLPAAGSDGTPVQVYIWYEGEDAGCKSDNAMAAALDAIDVDITFGLVTVA